MGLEKEMETAVFHLNHIFEVESLCEAFESVWELFLGMERSCFFNLKAYQ